MSRDLAKWLKTAVAVIPAAMAAGPVAAQTTAGTCLVIESTTLADNQPCIREMASRIDEEGHEHIVRTHVWPSGARTIVETVQEVFLVNGEDAVPVGGTMGLSCFFNRTTSRVFCFFEN
jgi:hypothetical protein